MFRKFALHMPHYSISLKYRLLLYFLLLVIMPTSIISATIYNESYRTITDNMKSSVQKNLNMVEAMLLGKFEEMNGIADSIYLNPDMIDLLSADKPIDQVDILNELTSLNKIMDSYDLPRDDDQGYETRLYMFNRPEYLQYNFSRSVSIIPQIEREPWYTELPQKAPYTIVPHGPQQAAKSSTIMLTKRLFGLKNPIIPYVGLLTVEDDVEDFNGILEGLKPSVHSSVMILDGKGNVVVSPDKELLGRNMASLAYAGSLPGTERRAQSDSFEETIGGKRMLVSYRDIEGPDWTVVSVSPVSDLNGRLVSFRKVMYVVLAGCMLLAFLVALLLSGNITNPIRKFIKSMSYAQEGNFDLQIQYSRKDEFTFLFSQYNKMIKQIKELINKLYVSEVKKKEAELKALQAQINPHFLYNTLDSINWIALRHRIPEISQMVTSLSDFFRYSLSKGKEVIPIEDEFRQVESYLSIQQVRFKERLQYSIDVEPEVHGHLTVKLILQPLVENSLLHGIERRRGVGVISIEARKQGERIVITVSDNGIGADVDRLNEMLMREERAGQGWPAASDGDGATLRSAPMDSDSYMAALQSAPLDGDGDDLRRRNGQTDDARQDGSANDGSARLDMRRHQADEDGREGGGGTDGRERNTSDGGGFGILNVHRRIIGTFGAGSGIRYSGHEGPGLTVTVSFPCMTNTEGENNDAEADYSG